MGREKYLDFWTASKILAEHMECASPEQAAYKIQVFAEMIATDETPKMALSEAMHTMEPDNK